MIFKSYNKDIFVQPVNGLGNRLRLIQSLYKLSLFRKNKLKIFWSSSSGFSGEKFEDLFDANSINQSVIEFISEEDFAKARENNFCLDNFIFQNDNLDYFVKDESNVIKKIMENSFCFKGSICIDHIFKNNNLIKKSFQKFKTDCFVSRLQPSNVLKSQISHIIKSFDSDILGVHIRRGDAINGPWKDRYLFSSLEMFFEKMEAHKGKIFLSTDCEKTQSKIISKFKDKIIYNCNKKFNKPEQSHLEEKPLQDYAAIDMYCLSACKNMIGTNWSSFSEMSSCIGRGGNKAFTC